MNWLYQLASCPPMVVEIQLPLISLVSPWLTVLEVNDFIAYMFLKVVAWLMGSSFDWIYCSRTIYCFRKWFVVMDYTYSWVAIFSSSLYHDIFIYFKSGSTKCRFLLSFHYVPWLGSYFLYCNSTLLHWFTPHHLFHLVGYILRC